MADAGGKTEAIGNKLLGLTGALFHHWHCQYDGTITRRTMRRRLRSLCWPVYEALEEGARTLSGKLGGMCGHTLDRCDHLWTFLEHPDMEPTNNASQRALRHAVIWRKLSFSTQSASGCRQQNRNVFAFVTHAVQTHFAEQPLEKSCPGVNGYSLRAFPSQLPAANSVPLRFGISICFGFRASDFEFPIL